MFMPCIMWPQQMGHTPHLLVREFCLLLLRMDRRGEEASSACCCFKHQIDFLKHRKYAHVPHLPTGYSLQLHLDPAVDMGSQGHCAVASLWAGVGAGCAAQGVACWCQHGSFRFPNCQS